MTDTTNLELPYLEAAQSQKHVTHNEALTMLDAIVHISVIDTSYTEPPGTPNVAEGQRYIVATGGTGAWSGWDNSIAAYQDGVWVEYVPVEGWLAWDQANEQLLVFNGAIWENVNTMALSIGAIALLGINGATADSTNRLSVNSPGVLFNRETDTFALTMNKQAAGNDNVIYFQTGFSTRVIMGNSGDDDFILKVSPNGSDFYTSISIDKDTGNMGVGTTADANNRLSVSGSSALFTNGSGSFSFVFSKNAVANDASLTFQTNYSSRCLLGLLGDDDTTLKVSPDGAAWTSAMIVDKDTAAVSHEQHPKFGGYCNYDQYNAAGAWFTVDINTLRHNDQSSISSGVFTAPHDGYYMFGAGVRHKTNSTVPAAMLLGFSVNSATPNSDALTQTGEGGAAIDDYTSLTVTACLKLSASDTVEAQAYFVTNDAYLDADYSYFWGAQIA